VRIDEIAVPVAMWKAASEGDYEARVQLQALCNELVLYEHLLVMPGKPSDYKFVTVREVDDILLTSWMSIKISFDFPVPAPPAEGADSTKLDGEPLP